MEESGLKYKVGEMNEIVLRGIIRNIKHSHEINGVEYLQAEVITQRKDKKEDSVIIKFKNYINKYKELDKIELVGNIRSHTESLSSGKNKVSVYVFTYQDYPDPNKFNDEINNEFVIDGRICKINELRTTQNGKKNLHFILANNIFTNNGQKINNYLPVTCWGSLAQQVSKMSVNDKVIIKGEMHSRVYHTLNSLGEKEYDVAHELLMTHIENIE